VCTDWHLNKHSDTFTNPSNRLALICPIVDLQDLLSLEDDRSLEVKIKGI
jgi:hypothetical protein